MMDEDKEPDQWDKYSYFNGIERKEFKAAPVMNSFREQNLQKDGLFYFKENQYEESNAREENFFKSIFLCACPTVGWLKFITIISFLEIFVFILEVLLKPKGVQHNDEFLDIDPGVLDRMGWQDSRKIRHKGQVWRWFSAILLHGNFEHLCANVVAQVFFGSGIENGISTKYMAVLYILSGFGGNLLSSVLNPTSYGVGASTAVFGLIGFYLQYIFTHFDYMGFDKTDGPLYRETSLVNQNVKQWTKLPWCQRCYLTLLVTVVIAINLNESAYGHDRVDNYAHVGGLITGFLAGIAICEWLDREALNKGRHPDRFFRMRGYEGRVGCSNIFCYWCGTLLLTAWLVTLIMVFFTYTVVDDEDYYDNIEVNYTPPEAPPNDPK